MENLKIVTEPPKYKMHLVPHIHWNREWFLTYQNSQMRLVDILDHVLEVLENDPKIKSYTLDGHTALVEDYLEIRPENKDKIIDYVKQKRLLIGPWFIETNQFLVSGESIIRNLILGNKISNKLGGRMDVGYLPDAPGHISQMPQILKGFGIDSAVVYRGMGCTKISELKTEYIWLSPDGTSVLLIYMPKGFNIVHTLKMFNITLASSEISKIQMELSSCVTTQNILLMCSTLSPILDLSKTIDQINDCINDGEIIFSDLPNYIESIRQINPNLEEIFGELLDCRRTCITPGVLSARVPIKQENEYIQTIMERWVEPYSTFTWILGAKYPEEYIWLAWKYLMYNQFCDTISGTCIDKVYDEVKVRFQKALEVAEVLTKRALEGIVFCIDTKESSPKDSYLVVFNPLPWQRTDLVEAIIDIPWEVTVSDIALYDSNDDLVTIQIVDLWTEQSANMMPLVRPFYKWSKRVLIAFIACNVPSNGYKTYKISYKSATTNNYQNNISIQPSVLENEYLKVEIKANGTLNITDKNTGTIYQDCNLFEDSGDAGDLYTFTPPLWNRVITSSNSEAEIELVKNGPVFSRYKVKMKIYIPEELTPSEEIPEEVILEGHPLCDLLDSEPYPSRTQRSDKLIENEIVSYITLASKSSRVDITTEVDNRSKEHRLRVLFPSDIKTQYSYSDTPFDIIRRPIEISYIGGEEEDAIATYPFSTFVDINDSNIGLAIISGGLFEYEVKNDGRNTIALTLLRCVGWLNRDILYNRRRHLAPILPTPDAQCLGKHLFNYSIFPHSGTLESAEVYKQAHQHNVPMRTIQTNMHDGILEKEMSFLSCTPDELIISAIKKAEKENAVIVRLYNISNRDVQGKLTIFEPIAKAQLVYLSEEPTNEDLVLDSYNTVSIFVKKHEIVTIEIFLK